MNRHIGLIESMGIDLPGKFEYLQEGERFMASMTVKYLQWKCDLCDIEDRSKNSSMPSEWGHVNCDGVSGYSSRKMDLCKTCNEDLVKYFRKKKGQKMNILMNKFIEGMEDSLKPFCTIARPLFGDFYKIAYKNWGMLKILDTPKSLGFLNEEFTIECSRSPEDNVIRYSIDNGPYKDKDEAMKDFMDGLELIFSEYEKAIRT